MKKQIGIMMAALALMSTPAFAEEISDVSLMITNGKIAAVEANDVETVQGQIKALNDLQNQIGTSQDIQEVKAESAEDLSPSHGLLQAIGQQIDNAQQQLKQMKASNNFDSIGTLKDTLAKELSDDQTEFNALLLN